MWSIKLKKLADVVSLDKIIHVISTITGMAPVFDRLTTDGKKLSKIGLIFSITNMLILFYLYNTLERLEETFRFFISNISYGMMVIKRNVDLWVPQIYIVGAFYQFSAFDKMLCKLDDFDVFLIKNHADLKYIKTTLRYVKILMLLYVLFSTGISLYSTIAYRQLFETIVPGHVFKSYVFYTNFFLATLKVCTYFYGISLRIDSFKWVLGEIKFRQFNRLDVIPRYQLKIRL